jgi:diaminopimelate epimerase
MKILFNKYEGAGNDFIIVRNVPKQIDPSDSRLSRRLCDRRFGIGSDGLILIEDCDGYDFRMIFINPDGSRGTMCGNGGRCASHFAMKHLTGFRDIAFMADDGPHKARSLGDDHIEISISDVHGVKKTGDGIAVNTGVPHLVVFTDDTDNIDVVAEGRRLRYSQLYAPDGVNVNFVQSDRDSIKVRTYERGVENETLACGTGVTASVIASAMTGKIVTNNPVVNVRGGTLSVSYTLTADGATDILLRGPATFVFSGEIEPYSAK